MLRHIHWRIPERHNAVAHVLVDGSLLVQDHISQRGHKPVQQRGKLFGRKFFRQARKSPDVAKKCTDVPCLAAEFANLRPGAPPEPDADAGVDEWEGDPQDAALYAEGSKLFWQAIERHGVTPESCKATICPDVDPRLFDTTLVAENVTEKVSVMDAEGRRRLVDPELQIRDAACRSFASKSGNATESQWCDANCAAGYCPRYRCVCSGISGSNAGQPAPSRAHLDLRGQRFGPGRPAGAAFVRFEED